MKSFSSRELLRQMKYDGWYEVRCIGDHHQFRHPTKKGLATLTHPVKDVPPGTVKSLEAQTGIKFQ